MKEQVLVINSHVLVKLADGEMRSHGGIIIPQGAGERDMQFGTVIEVGEGYPQLDPDYDSSAPPDSAKPKSRVFHLPLKVRKYDMVFFFKGTGALIDLDGTKHVVLQENDIKLIKRQEF